MPALPSRRRLLAAAAAGVAALAGCTAPDDAASSGQPAADDGATAADGATEANDERTTTDDEGTATAGETADDGTTAGDLDLREANVVAVSVESAGDGEYRFDVTLIHDDDGEDGYANWWQVETLDGERLGRRELLHAHGTREFTRSKTVPVPAGAEQVVVRGHDRTHGYGGQAMVVTLATGETRVHRQGSEREPAA